MLKYEKVGHHIGSMLEKGAFRQEQPVTINDLADELGVNARTVSKGLEPYLARNLLRTVKSKGIVEVTSGISLASAGVGLVMQVNDHYYGHLANTIAAKLNDRKIAPFFIDLASLQLSPCPESRLHPFLDRHAHAFVLDGVGYHERPYLQALHNAARVVFAHIYEAPGLLPESAVLVDFEAGARLATQHLLEFGHEHIALATYLHQETGFQDELHRSRCRHIQFVRGCVNALRETDNERELPVYWQNRGDGVDPALQWEAMMSKSDRPTAFVCSSDICATDVMNRALAMGLRVPEDVAIVGCYNTPWTEMCPVTLTSLDLQVGLQARWIVEEIAAAAGETQMRRVKPKLIVRASTAG